MMSIATIKTTDKIKLLDQMLEDLAGDEFDDYDSAETSIPARAKQFSDAVAPDSIESMH